MFVGGTGVLVGWGVFVGFGVSVGSDVAVGCGVLVGGGVLVASGASVAAVVDISTIIPELTGTVVCDLPRHAQPVPPNNAIATIDTTQRIHRLLVALVGIGVSGGVAMLLSRASSALL